jgi:hypothetical protein
VKRTALGVSFAMAYAWRATGIAPFSVLSYLLVAAPVTALLTSYASLGALSPHRDDIERYYRGRAADASLKSVSPWIALLGAAAALEAVALALGGRSRSVPSLSTTVDHLLVTHLGRWLLFLAWLGVGARAVVRLALRPSDEAT